MITNNNRNLDPELFVGTRLGKLLVTEFVGRRGNLRYKLLCDCGQVDECEKFHLVKKKRECKACISERQKNVSRVEGENFVGKIFGDLTITKMINRTTGLCTVDCKCGRREQVRLSQLRGTKKRCRVCLSKKRKLTRYAKHIYCLVRDYEQELKDENSRDSRVSS